MNYTFDNDSKSYKLNVTWTQRLVGDQAYVAEKIGDGHVTEYGPMPPDMVKPLIEELRAIVEKQFEATRARFLESASGPMTALAEHPWPFAAKPTGVDGQASLNPAPARAEQQPER